jgi:hypothetical protein
VPPTRAREDSIVDCETGDRRVCGRGVLDARVWATKRNDGLYDVCDEEGCFWIVFSLSFFWAAPHESCALRKFLGSSAVGEENGLVSFSSLAPPLHLTDRTRTSKS